MKELLIQLAMAGYVISFRDEGLAIYRTVRIQMRKTVEGRDFNSVYLVTDKDFPHMENCLMDCKYQLDEHIEREVGGAREGL